ncbi:hypothetical protein [Methylobacterium oryzihabitans]|uniref:Uncharacterized protein n=1 Tax=Methylobacterium oryzihabitans TaxID=2499852 RepID=A0A3S2VMS9_9HYPH|nr:hypothetical protein [Methylobacterium oryzihabitans]RVU16333.1 hypothetical protein EOE48_16710 [Methylobacterium oryzihabitans]
MEHQPLRQLRDIADIELRPALVEGRRARLERWAELLEREPDRAYATLEEIEFVPRAMRAAIRADNSPLAVAFADPVLRASGLSGDSFGEARDFFELGTGEAHRLLCSCVNGRSVTGRATARRLHRMAARNPGLWLAYGCAAGVLGLPGLIYLLG